MVTLADLTTKMVSQNLQLDATVNTIAFKQFTKVQKTTHLGLVSRILEKDEFLTIEDDVDKIVSRIDLLDFISNGA